MGMFSKKEKIFVPTNTTTYPLKASWMRLFHLNHLINLFLTDYFSLNQYYNAKFCA